jgi:hypothetical protein
MVPLSRGTVRRIMKKRESTIVALCIISESEIAKVIPTYSKDFEVDNPVAFRKMLWEIGLDTSRPFERQDGLWHRNRLNEVVMCSRYVGHERLDAEWLASGYASVSAMDKASGCRILEDIYRARNLTEDRQAALADREKYTVEDQTVQG